MALTTCPECAGPVSSLAAACPTCGRANSLSMSPHSNVAEAPANSSNCGTQPSDTNAVIRQATSRVRRRLGSLLALPIIAAGLVALANYWFVQRDLSAVLSDDPRNSGVVAHAHYDNFIDPNVIVFDLRGVKGSSMLDVFRVLLQFAAAQKEQRYTMVKLAFKGDTRFELNGDHFHTLGVEYGQQKPAYTMRTFPENLLRPDGTRAFGTLSGGWLGVASHQIENFSDFHKQWYLSDLSK
jgi:hypothetical protein